MNSTTRQIIDVYLGVWIWWVISDTSISELPGNYWQWLVLLLYPHTRHIKTRTDLCNSDHKSHSFIDFLVTIVSFLFPFLLWAEHWEKRISSLMHDMSFTILCYLFLCSVGGAEVRVNGNLFTTGNFTGTRPAFDNLLSAVIGLQASLLFVIH